MPFCYAPWTNIDINPNGIIKPCCKFICDENPHTVYTSSITEYTNSAFLSSLKDDFTNGIKNTGCRRCWAEEDNNIKSKRLLDLDRWQLQYDAHGLETNNFLTISLGMGNVCNLKCRICSTTASSKWIKEEEFYTNTRGQVHDFYKDRTFISQIKELLNSIVHIDFPGGEPLVAGTNEHLEVLDVLINSNRANEVSLHYTTNLTIYPDKKFWDRWQHFRNVDLQFSIDGTYKQFEYNRYPASWNTCYTNLKKYQDVNRSNIQISVAHTLSVFTIFYLPEFFDWCKHEGLPKPWVGRLDKPKYYQAGVFPISQKQSITNKLQQDLNSDVSIWSDEVWMHDSSDQLNELHQWIKKVDQYRNQSFSNTFPELVELLCLPS